MTKDELIKELADTIMLKEFRTWKKQGQTSLWPGDDLNRIADEATIKIKITGKVARQIVAIDYCNFCKALSRKK